MNEFMTITVSQQNKKISIKFYHPKPLLDKEGRKGRLIVESFVVDKSDEFLSCIDRMVIKNKMKLETLRNAQLEFQNTGLLTERIIRVIILGLSF